jgi:hypothetical protein
LTRFGPEERDAIFVPWWRTVVTVLLTAIPIAVTPILAQSTEQVGTWLGPLSVVPLVYWLYRRIKWAGQRHDRKVDGAAN